MGKCINHTDVETRFVCQKHNYYVCEKCMRHAKIRSFIVSIKPHALSGSWEKTIWMKMT